jgi:Na+/H+-dicarboxylate symporter
MTSPLGWPLHYQILAAMTVGAAVGLVVNPGEKELPDARITVAKADGKLRVAGPGKYTEQFADFAALKKRFPELADEYQQSGKDTVTINVTHRRAHLSEDGRKITLRYVRLHDGKKAVSSYEAATLDKLVAENPEWMPQRKDAIDWYADLAVRHVAVWSKFLGDLFLRLLRMITVPLIVTSLVTGVAGLGSTSRLGSMFGKTMLYYFVTSMLAIFTGIAMVNLVRPGIGVSLPFGGKAVAAGQNQSLATIFTNLINSMVPPNPVQALAEGEFLSIITFSILVGVFIIKVGGKSGETLSGFFQAGFDVMMDMTQAVIRLAPIGVLAFMLFATCTQGIEVFKTFAWYMVTVALALLFHAVVTLPLIVWLVAKRSPWEYAKAMTPALLTAFSTASSNGTLPLTMTSVEERAGVSNRVSSFVLPLGATVNMDGTALYEAVAVLFIAQAVTGGLTFEQQIIVAVTALLASVGAAGIPSAGLVMMAIVLQAVGLPLEAVGLIIAVDRVLDMARTSVNVWSDSCGCAVLNRFEPDPSPSEVAAS